MTHYVFTTSYAKLLGKARSFAFILIVTFRALNVMNPILQRIPVRRMRRRTCASLVKACVSTQRRGLELDSGRQQSAENPLEAIEQGKKTFTK